MTPKLSTMCYQLLLSLCLQITLLNAAPLLLLPIPWMTQSSQQMVLQKQLMELQALQQLNVQSPFQMNNQQPPQPLLVLLPNDQLNPNMLPQLKLNTKNDYKNDIHTNLETENEDLNSIVIDAASEEIEKQKQPVLPHPQRAIVLLPNGRLSIGEIISAIPWLPFEVNVPDTIAWAYNGIVSGIGSIITIIGRPLQGTSQEMQTQEVGLKSLMKQVQMRNQHVVRPIMMVPIDGPVLPIQV